MKLSRGLALASVLGAVLLATAACALIDKSGQCSTNDDCTQFNAVCDVVQSVCVAKGDQSAETADGSVGVPGDAGAGTADDTPPSPPLPASCTISPKPVASAAAGLAKIDDAGASLTGALTLGCDKDWTLDAQLVVGAGATLTIQPGTTIRAKKGSGASIVVLPGGKIVATGAADNPIVITSDDAAPKPGDWRGVFVLGKAPRSGTAPLETDPLLAYGGGAADDSSGSIGYLRIEYAQSGIEFGGVGNKTTVDHVQVRQSNDNCFVFNGGTVAAKHLVCQSTFDEQFEANFGFAGKLQFLFGQRSSAGADHNGLLLDGDQTAPSIYNVTLCGLPETPSQGGTGLVFRNGAKLDANDMIVTGWRDGFDVTSPVIGLPSNLRGSAFFGNVDNPAAIEADAGTGTGPLDNDDNGFDEIAFFGAGGNVTTNPNLTDCYSLTAPKPWPKTALATGAKTAPSDGFFEAAAYIGAFKDENDAWMKGWTRFDAQ